MELLIQTRNTASGDYTPLPYEPSSYSIDWEDLDLDSYRSVVNGNLNRNVLNRRWAKISLSFAGLEESDIDTILKRVNNPTLYIKAKSPAFGTGGFIEFQAYVSKMQVEQILGTDRWSLSFNIIQSTAASFQS